MGAVAEWVKVVDWRPGGPWFESSCGNIIRLGTLKIVYPALPVCFGGDTTSRLSLLSGVYAQLMLNTWVGQYSRSTCCGEIL